MLALICGAGDLPKAVATAAAERPLVCVLQGFAPNGLLPDITFRLETLGSLFQDLTARGVTHVCFCGHIRRPSLDPTQLDAATLPLVPKFQEAQGKGDDGALRVVLALFAGAGFGILSPQDAAPSLLPFPGILTRKTTSPETDSLAQLGDRVLDDMGAADLGQACVLRNGMVLAREDEDGTAAMLERLADGQVRPNAVLYKAPKPGQDRRADLPVIGPETVSQVVNAGLSGLIIEAGGVMVLDLDTVLQACNAADLFLWVRERPA